MTVDVITALTPSRTWVTTCSSNELSLITLKAFGIIAFKASIVHIATGLALTAVRGIENHHRVGFVQALGTTKVVVASLTRFATL